MDSRGRFKRNLNLRLILQTQVTRIVAGNKKGGREKVLVGKVSSPFWRGCFK